MSDQNITDKLTAALGLSNVSSEWNKRSNMAPLHLVLVECVDVLQGCSDGNCRMLRPRGGQHTNGGCKCRDRAEQALAQLAEVLK